MRGRTDMAVLWGSMLSEICSPPFPSETYNNGRLVQYSQGREVGVAGERAQPRREGIAEHLAEEHEQHSRDEEEEREEAPDNATRLRGARAALAALAVAEEWGAFAVGGSRHCR